jgi:dihydrofolate reductase
MSKLRIQGFTISLDGYGAGPGQSLDEPLGVNGESLHGWLHHQFDDDPSATKDPVDQRYFARMTENIGAVIMGRNMFGPVRGEWPDEDWKGWWGDNPPYHTDVFVLTHHERVSQPMAGGTTFHFVTGGIEPATAQARAAAGGRDVLVAGGVSTVQQFLRAGLVDEMHLALSPLLLGRGERLFAFDDAPVAYRCTGFAPSAHAVHASFVRAG